MQKRKKTVRWWWWWWWWWWWREKWNPPALKTLFLSFSLTAFLLLPIISLNNIPVSGLQLDHRDLGSLLASGVANKKDKEQMVVFVIPSSFQPPGKHRHLSLSLSLSPSLHHSSIAGVWIGPNLGNASSLVGMDLHNQMVRLFGAINSLRESVGTCLQQRFGGCAGWMCWMTFLLKVPPRKKKFRRGGEAGACAWEVPGGTEWKGGFLSRQEKRA